MMLFVGLGMQATWGEDIHHFAARMAVAASSIKMTIAGTHNDFALWAVPGMTGEDILLPWHDQWKRNYLRGV